MKSHWLTLLKIVLPAAVIAWLLSRLEPEQLDLLRSQPKRWDLLAAAFAATFTAVSLSFVRWWLLVRTLDLPFRLQDAFRLGFMGFLFNFISAGSVGGDLFKAVFIAREQPRRRAEAVATVLVDRVVGLYALLLVASAGILAGGVPQQGAVRIVCQTTLALAAGGGVGILALMLPWLTEGRLAAAAGRVPLIGPALSKVIAGVRLYKSRPQALLLIAVCAVGTHVTLSVGVALIAWGLFPRTPTMLEHLVIVPLAMIANGLPLTPGGLGAMEVAMDELYRIVPSVSHDVSGVLVALVYRLTTLAIAGVGAVFYIFGGRQVQEALRQAEAEAAAARPAADGGGGGGGKK